MVLCDWPSAAWNNLSLASAVSARASPGPTPLRLLEGGGPRADYDYLNGNLGMCTDTHAHILPQRTFHSSPANDFTFRAPRPPAPKYLLRSISAGLPPPQLRPGEQQSGPPDASCPSPVSRAACGHTYWECMIWVLVF